MNKVTDIKFLFNNLSLSLSFSLYVCVCACVCVRYVHVNRMSIHNNATTLFTQFIKKKFVLVYNKDNKNPSEGERFEDKKELEKQNKNISYNNVNATENHIHIYIYIYIYRLLILHNFSLLSFEEKKKIKQQCATCKTKVRKK